MIDSGRPLFTAGHCPPWQVCPPESTRLPGDPGLPGHITSFSWVGGRSPREARQRVHWPPWSLDAVGAGTRPCHAAGWAARWARLDSGAVRACSGHSPLVLGRELVLGTSAQFAPTRAPVCRAFHIDLPQRATELSPTLLSVIHAVECHRQKQPRRGQSPTCAPSKDLCLSGAGV